MGSGCVRPVLQKKRDEMAAKRAECLERLSDSRDLIADAEASLREATEDWNKAINSRRQADRKYQAFTNYCQTGASKTPQYLVDELTVLKRKLDATSGEADIAEKTKKTRENQLADAKASLERVQCEVQELSENIADIERRIQALT